MPFVDYWSHYAAVTPHDTNDVGFIFDALYVGTAGNVVVVREDGTAVTIPNWPAGLTQRLRGRRVNFTGTTASGIVAYKKDSYTG